MTTQKPTKKIQEETNKSPQNYVTQNVEVCCYASGIPEHFEKIIGKRIKKIINREYRLKIIFTDNSFMEIQGHTYDDCSLDIDCED